MTEAVIQATYADYRRVKGRKVLQLVCEVPIEQAPLVHKTFGEPNPDGSLWVAIAKLDPKKASNEQQDEPEKPKRKWDEMKASQQAGMRCEEHAFAQFLKEKRPQAYTVNNGNVAGAVRSICAVASRSELDRYAHGQNLWRLLDHEYRAWQRAPAHGG